MRHAVLGLAALAGGCHLDRVVGLQAKAAPLIRGTRATPFTLPSHTGAQVELATALAARDVVLVFYRGHW